MNESKVMFVSGGAGGADVVWESTLTKRGFHVSVMSFDRHSITTSSSENVETVILHPAKLKNAHQYVIAAGKFLGRRPPRDEYVCNLLRRNWWIVEEADVVVGVGSLKRLDKGVASIEGGTAYVYAMAATARLPSLRQMYLFDQARDKWFHYEDEEWKDIDENSVVSEIQEAAVVAVVGSRNLTPSGHRAISSVVDKLSFVEK